MRIAFSILLVPMSLILSSTQQVVVAAPFDSIVPALESREPLFSDYTLQNRDLPTGTCNANTPCKSSPHQPRPTSDGPPLDCGYTDFKIRREGVNAACCGTNGLCGYSPTECGSGNCTSNCDAKAQCGQYGTPGSQSCPLNVCCSQFGYDIPTSPRR